MTKEFMTAFVLIIVALVFSLVGAVILALPLGLAGGYLLIKEMLRQYNQ